ncbi:hypothetical protein Gxy13693_033_075 [Komagataeibacter xylinus NBRC 13693]|uniref:Uncharacterized protein n=1 Tax=Komagataeibacter xylinus NBRC 13693 TaxID=1234668 RepID=A0A0D6QAR9_KOMXY|nr:hypothetical protein [Komagataeibacter xylinus]GAN99901.1 hypothetical protein Gxy13693_033_075 [Komagataeibacter xylinus NBRC 13693]
MIVQDTNFFCDMPADMKYLRDRNPPQNFLEQNMIFVLPQRLRKFRKNLFHVRRTDADATVYAPLFQVRCITEHDPVPEGYDGPFDVFPFYTNPTRRRRRTLDYYVLFLFQDKLSYVRCRDALDELLS